MIKMREKQQERDALKQLIDQTYLDKIVMIEVGSYAGESADIFASTGKVKTLYCIDPWKSGYDSRDIASSSDFAEVESEFDRVAKKHGDIIVKFKGTLEQFIEKNPEVKPDVIYIDACHTYEAVKQDIQNAMSLKPEFIGGHDYCDGWSGVKRAINERFGAPDKTFFDESWIVKTNFGKTEN